ncbi:type II toxin-antitoxin system VapC family toxin [Oryzibacter oryziterrae]|uniref:type II toxin-antitoxin system VapC family toxin n=1 Tax=Oryzibacter oryziterrae TaxID=2766474 RepID=UPI001F3701F8|nr:type II toxin-antitoxin system VapC family toxin [Oryzibacter oryziterrae]
MIFIDSSVIVAILKPEPDARELVELLEAAPGPFHFSPLVRYEATISLAHAMARLDAPHCKPTADQIALAHEAVSLLAKELNLQEVAITDRVGLAALDAGMRFGKAIGHPADLNFGDCFSYACTRIYGLRLLFKGNDFSMTDIANARDP